MNSSRIGTKSESWCQSRSVRFRFSEMRRDWTRCFLRLFSGRVDLIYRSIYSVRLLVSQSHGGGGHRWLLANRSLLSKTRLPGILTVDGMVKRPSLALLSTVMEIDSQMEFSMCPIFSL